MDSTAAEHAAIGGKMREKKRRAVKMEREKRLGFKYICKRMREEDIMQDGVHDVHLMYYGLKVYSLTTPHGISLVIL